MLSDIFVGAASAACSVPFFKPLMYFKNQMQSGSPISRDPRVWYIGSRGLAASFLPTVGLQTAAKGALEKHTDTLTASGLAGAASGVVACPAEGIMIQQEITKRSYFQVTRDIVSRYGVGSLFRSVVPTMVREGSFAFGYLGLAPMVKKELQEQGLSKTASRVASGVIAGTLVATVSHPFDTAKTRIQSDLSKNPPLLQEIVRRDVFKGVGWRCAMMSVAVTAISEAQELFKGVIDE